MSIVTLVAGESILTCAHRKKERGAGFLLRKERIKIVYNIPNSFNCSFEISEGASIIISLPALFLGKAI